MYAPGKSDEVIVSMKRTNKSAQPRNIGHPLAESVEKRPSTEGNLGQSTVSGTQGPQAASSGLSRIREAARRNSKSQFTNLLHHITPSLLSAAFEALNPKAAAGVDEMTWEKYGRGLEEHLPDLHERIQSMRYRAKPSLRTWIPKSDGRLRPLGIAALEDKIVQQALVWILQEIYEEEFVAFSYGFRPGRSQHDALDAVYVAVMQKKVSWVLDADIESFYDTLDQDWLMRFVEHRV